MLHSKPSLNSIISSMSNVCASLCKKIFAPTKLTSSKRLKRRLMRTRSWDGGDRRRTTYLPQDADGNWSD